MAMQDSKAVATDETNTLISSDKVEGTAVYNRTGEKLGSIHTVMIDKVSGKVAYAVMSFGGFLGIGDRYNPLPWDVFTYGDPLSGRLCRRSRSQQAQRGAVLRYPAKRRTGAIAAGASRYTTTTASLPIGSKKAPKGRAAPQPAPPPGPSAPHLRTLGFTLASPDLP